MLSESVQGRDTGRDCEWNIRLYYENTDRQKGGDAITDLWPSALV